MQKHLSQFISLHSSVGYYFFLIIPTSPFPVSHFLLLAILSFLYFLLLSHLVKHLSTTSYYWLPQLLLPTPSYLVSFFLLLATLSTTSFSQLPCLLLPSLSYPVYYFLLLTTLSNTSYYQLPSLLLPTPNYPV